MDRDRKPGTWFLTGSQQFSVMKNVSESLAGRAFFETAVVSELVKSRFAAGIKPELYFWRAQSGVEIDVLIPEKGSIIPCEIKLSTTIKPQFYKDIISWLELSGKKGGMLITNSRDNLPLPGGIRNVHWKELYLSGLHHC